MSGAAADLRYGRWQDVLADVTEVDAIITDPPYGSRTHRGFRSGGRDAGSVSQQPGIIEYKPLPRDEVVEFVKAWEPRVRRWFVVFGDHITCLWWLEAFDAAGLYTFAPLAWVRRDAAPRFTGDGPQRSAEWIAVARRRGKTRCGSLPGYYLVHRVEGKTNGSQLPGQKPLVHMRALMRDYTRPGDLVVDPYAGTGTTLIAASIEGRRSIGAERNPETYEIAAGRLRGGWTPSMFPEAE